MGDPTDIYEDVLVQIATSTEEGRKLKSTHFEGLIYCVESSVRGNKSLQWSTLPRRPVHSSCSRTWASLMFMSAKQPTWLGWTSSLCASTRGISGLSGQCMNMASFRLSLKSLPHKTSNILLENAKEADLGQDRLVCSLRIRKRSTSALAAMKVVTSKECVH